MTESKHTPGPLHAVGTGVNALEGWDDPSAVSELLEQAEKAAKYLSQRRGNTPRIIAANMRAAIAKVKAQE